MGIVTFTAFCKQLHLQPCPASKHAATLFAAHQSKTLRIQTITVYPTAISYLHHSNGFQSTVTRNPKMGKGSIVTMGLTSEACCPVLAMPSYLWRCQAKQELCSIIPLPVWQATVSPKATVHPPFSVVPEQLRPPEL
ncbi:hypothetical protein EMCRGX_G002798 [Ephydatia muelleri]